MAREMRAMGVDHLFLMTGRDNALWIALEAQGVRQVLAHSEGAAVYMADAYARVTGRPAFTYGAYGPGAANVAGALAEPFWSTTPLVALVSAMRRTERFRKEYQELDQVPLFSSVTKWSAEASDGAHVPRLLRQAVRRSATGTPGPVYLGIPGDLFESELPSYDEPPAASRAIAVPLARPAPARAEVEGVLDALSTASRPVILAGTGVHHSQAYGCLLAVAERLAIPVATSSGGKGSIPETHDLALGTVGRYSRKYANEAVRNADLVLAIGTGLGGLVTDSYKLINPDAVLIHVTVDPEAIDLNFPAQHGIVADARAFLQELYDAAARRGAEPSPGAERNRDALGRARRAWQLQRADIAARDGSAGTPLRPEAVMAAIDEMMADDTIVVADTGYAAAWAGTLTHMRSGGRSFLRADGSLGWAFPASLGAQLAAPERPVVCITGDGGIGYHIADVETALRHDLPVIVVVLNNSTLGFEEHVQHHLYGHVVPQVNSFRDVDYSAVARALGGAGERVCDLVGFRDAFARGLERHGPTVIDVVIDRDAMAPVTRYDRVREREL